MRHSRIAASAALLMLGGCSIFSGKDKGVEPPMALTEFKPSVEFKRVLSAKVGKSGKDLRLGLAPIGDGSRVYAASADGNVWAFDAQTGKQAWKVNLKVVLSAGPGVGDARVVVAGRNGDVIALDARTGEELWRRDVAAEVLSTPAMGAQRVVMRTVDGRLLALDASSGEELWFHEQAVPRLSQRGIGSPVIAGSTVVAGFDNGRVMAVSLLQGEKLWELPIGIPAGRSDIQRMVDVDGAIAAVGQDVYVTGFQARTGSIALESGQALWARDVSSYAGLAVDWTNVYLATDDDRVVALSRENGAQEWSNEQLLRRELGTPVSFGEYVAVPDFEGYVHFLSARTGLISARIKVADSPISSRMYVMGNTLYVQSESGSLHGYRIKQDGA